jgi:PAS domain S-box-containing protein/diguanylate cyclase (GGDEF)-like protein
MIFLKNKQAVDVPVSVVKVKIDDGKIKVLEKEIFSKSLSELTGWSKEHIDNTQNWWFINIHEDDFQNIYSKLLNLIKGEFDYIQVKYRFKKPDQSYIWINHTILILERTKEYVEVLTFWSDISLYKEKQDIFKIFENNPYVGIFIYGKKFIYSNKAAEELYGYTKEELENMEVKDLIHSSIVNYVSGVVSKRLSGEINQPLTYENLPSVHKNGKVIYVHTYTDQIYFNGKNAGLIILVDNTKQHKMEMFGKVLFEINKIFHDIKKESGFLQKLTEVLVEKLPVSSVLSAEFDGVENKFRTIKHLVSKTSKGVVHPEIEYFNFGDKNTDVILANDISDDYFYELLSNQEYLHNESFTSVTFLFHYSKNIRFFISVYFCFPYFFEGIEFIAKRLKQDIDFAFLSISQNRNRNILYYALENSKDWVLITNREGEIIYVNNAVCEISGYSRNELLGENPRLLKSGLHEDIFYKDLWDTILSGKIFSSLFTNKHKDGIFYQLDYTISPIIEDNEITHFVAVSKDITKEKYLEEEILKFKYSDFLIGINNREGFFKDAADVVTKFTEIKPFNMLFILDIKNFSNLNKIHGNYICDCLLLKIKDRLISYILNEDVIGRTGSDEFSILLRLKNTEEVINIIREILMLFKQPFVIDDVSITITVNIGAVVFKASNDLDEECIKEEFNKALSALVIAKKAGENTFRFFNEQINEIVVKDFEKNDLIRNALENDWFRLFLQPYYDTKTKKILGFEGLLRIEHPDKGLIFPGDFIDALENFYLLPDVEKWIIKTASSYLSFFHKNYSEELSLSINISAKSFNNKTIYNLLNETDNLIPLHLEITERLFMGDIDKIEVLLNSIKEMKHMISIDDFGTEYSSLAYLYKLPIDRVKIDISFIRNMLNNNKQFIVVRNIIRLCRELGLETLAEGVETEQQFRTLQMLDCNLVQGYYFSKPVPFDNAVELLNNS